MREKLSRKTLGFATVAIFLITMLPASGRPLGEFPLLADSARPVIHSIWTATHPTIDGKFAPGEYGDPQIVFSVPPYNSSYLNASVYFTNDAGWLYVMVDATGDQTDDILDEALVIFGFTPDGFASSTVVAFRGLAGFKCSFIGGNEKPSYNCVVPNGAHAAIGYDTSPTSADKHKIYEGMIPVEQLPKVGQRMNFSSPKVNAFTGCAGKGCEGGSLGYDEKTSKDNVWPQELVMSNVETWGILVLAVPAAPVPEFTGNGIMMIAASMLVASLYLLRGRRHRPP
jgi:hypothetical protein